jgi:hypothetical protein
MPLELLVAVPVVEVELEVALWDVVVDEPVVAVVALVTPAPPVPDPELAADEVVDVCPEFPLPVHAPERAATSPVQMRARFMRPHPTLSHTDVHANQPRNHAKRR